MKSKNISISLSNVSKSDLQFLYNLLKGRDPIVNISHHRMPTYQEHKNFVLSKPYSEWYIIKFGKQKIGSAYITNLNEIAIHIIKEMQNKKFEYEVLKLIIKMNSKPRYLANVNPKNKKCIEFFKNNGFKLIQHTYEFRK